MTIPGSIRPHDPASLPQAAELARRTVAVAEPYAPRLSLLQVNAGNGHLLAVLRAIGWRIQGLEPVPQLCALARERYDLPMFPGDLAAWLKSPLFRPFPMLLFRIDGAPAGDSGELIKMLQAALEPDGVLVLCSRGSAFQPRLPEGGFALLHQYRCRLDDIAQRLPQPAPPSGRDRMLSAATRAARAALQSLGAGRKVKELPAEHSDLELARRWLEEQPGYDIDEAANSGSAARPASTWQVTIARRL